MRAPSRRGIGPGGNQGGCINGQDYMQVKVAIDKFGVTQTATGTIVPSGGATILRRRQNYYIQLSDTVTVDALIGLLRAVRSLGSPLTFHLDDAQQQPREPRERADLCIAIARKALIRFEAHYDCPFVSSIEQVNKDILHLDGLPPELMQLAMMNTDNMDVPTALLHASNLHLMNLCLIGLNRAMRLYFINVPEQLRWPAFDEPPVHPLEDELDEQTAKWLSIIYEAALSTQRPLFHHGTIRLSPNQNLPFQRILYPIVPAGSRPTNFRILSLAAIENNEDLIII